MDADFCVAALEEAITRYGRPGIFNTDQGSQFTSFAFANTLNDVGHPRLDGRPWPLMDNVFIERLWRSLKYECVFLNAFETGSRSKNQRDRSLDRLLQRRSTALGPRRQDGPDETYAIDREQEKLAA